MNYSQRIEVLTCLGDIFRHVDENHPVLFKAHTENAWFTIPNQMRAIKQWSEVLEVNQIENWLKKYDLPNESSEKTVAIVMAGNIPLVGLHDLICVLAAGFKVLVKPSSDDAVLIEWVITCLKQKFASLDARIQVIKDKKLEGFDAVIATGSNNSFRYFEYYFKDKASLLRKNRNSIAVLAGDESETELDLLADDILTYFGMGCRNVSKVLIPEGFDIKLLIQKLEKYNNYIHHHKFANNYTYHKAIFLMNLNEHLDAGFLIIKQDPKIAAPIGVLFYDFYKSMEEVETLILEKKDELQCIVSKLALKDAIPYGSSQKPSLETYADGEDTLMFLSKLSRQ
jgi:hypothetical protein